MSLRVIGAGFGRTGTRSLKAALELLHGGRCHHMDDVLTSPSQVRAWHAVATGAPPDWEAIFAGFDASCDFPSSTRYAALCEHYPDARVILTVREPSAWYRSATESIRAMSEAVPRWCLHIPHVRRAHEMVDRLVWEGIFDGRFDDEIHACRVFEAHIEDVVATVPSERLLVMSIGDGWEPLCEHLGVPVPSVPFPRVNERASFGRRLRLMRGLDLLPLPRHRRSG